MAASLLPNGKQQFVDANGIPLAGGTVQFYVPGTTTPKDTWQDTGETILNTNPIVLDGSGQAIIYGEGVYRQVVKDVDGNLIWDQLTMGPLVAGDAFNTLVQNYLLSLPTVLPLVPNALWWNGGVLSRS